MFQSFSTDHVDKPPESEGVKALTPVHLFCKGHNGAGVGSWAYVVNLPNSDTHKSSCDSTKDATANAMEITACYHGFEALTRPCLVSVFTNSMYLLSGIKMLLDGTHYDSNILRWARLLDAIAPHVVSVTHIPKIESTGYMRLADSIALNLIPPEGRR